LSFDILFLVYLLNNYGQIYPAVIDQAHVFRPVERLHQIQHIRAAAVGDLTVSRAAGQKL
jgi:hypothetical protein